MLVPLFLGPAVLIIPFLRFPVTIKEAKVNKLHNGDNRVFGIIVTGANRMEEVDETERQVIIPAITLTRLIPT
ncbi:MAG TPA: hypothetical protein VK619_09215 [Pyrinomonadaceae bacterium]|nr:hypothetical protein [Pyrinomonadaceae bacterium]